MEWEENVKAEQNNYQVDIKKSNIRNQYVLVTVRNTVKLTNHNDNRQMTYVALLLPSTRF